MDFETTWCGPCKVMDEWVYTADGVVEAAQSVVSVKVDGDERLDLKERFGVTGFPTMILLDADGEEVGRAAGYVNVVDMTEFMKMRRIGPGAGQSGSGDGSPLWAQDSRSLTTTRRFSFRPSGVPLSATGWSSPIPTASKRLGSIPFPVM